MNPPGNGHINSEKSKFVKIQLSREEEKKSRKPVFGRFGVRVANFTTICSIVG